jgi:uncharacterized protein DUF4238
MPEQVKNRKDHILPQCYLDGFTNSDGVLWVYHVAEKRWFPRKPQDVAWVRGFYDYSDGVTPDQTADDAFREHEGRYPEVRRELVASNFSVWRRHLPFLLEYFNHLRVRSVVWRQHVLNALDQQPPMVVDEVLETVPHPTDPGMVRQKVRVKPMPQTGADLKTALTNLTISKMRADLLAVPQFFYDFDWCLRYTTDPAQPVITADEPIRLEGDVQSEQLALGHFWTRIHFPLCWQACLIGSPKAMLPKTRLFSPSHLRELQRKYLSSACRFVYSPMKLG